MEGNCIDFMVHVLSVTWISLKRKVKLGQFLLMKLKWNLNLSDILLAKPDVSNKKWNLQKRKEKESRNKYISKEKMRNLTKQLESWQMLSLFIMKSLEINHA